MYFVREPMFGNKFLVWDAYMPTLSELIKAAEKEFPGIPIEKLEITIGGSDGNEIHFQEN